MTSPDQVPYPTPVLSYHRKSHPSINPSLSKLSTVGKTIAFSFAESSTSHLGLTGRRASKLEETKSRVLSSFPSTSVHLPPDNNKIDILVADAGYANDHNTLEQVDPDQFWTAFEINTDPVVLHVSVGLAHFPYMPGHGPYAASKLAVVKIFNWFKYESPEITMISFHTRLLMTIFCRSTKVSSTVDLAGSFVIWAASTEAAFLDSRLVWATWDVDALKAQASELEQNSLRYTVGLLGFPGPRT
ncbi:oxidoreductase-like protein 1 [Triangularia setosa]|uniref:Oxidoreductase-like protein 1 n=1 Tax=Triangularia setosa TaxID=2587417 RepID=A0AAN6W1Q2_9PEZI|nr:oxidoreductase-like protein 1 [Podospora setosa]